jgi:hypothetical protein
VIWAKFADWEKLADWENLADYSSFAGSRADNFSAVGKPRAAEQARIV